VAKGEFADLDRGRRRHPEPALAAANHLASRMHGLLIGATAARPGLERRRRWRRLPAPAIHGRPDYVVATGRHADGDRRAFRDRPPRARRARHIAFNGLLIAGATCACPRASRRLRPRRRAPTSCSAGTRCRRSPPVPASACTRFAALNHIRVNGLLIAGADAGGPRELRRARRSDDDGAPHYVVQPGDTLSAIASRAGVAVNRLAAFNGSTSAASCCPA